MRSAAVVALAGLAGKAIAHGHEWACYAGPWRADGEFTPVTTIPLPWNNGGCPDGKCGQQTEAAGAVVTKAPGYGDYPSYPNYPGYGGQDAITRVVTVTVTQTATINGVVATLTLTTTSTQIIGGPTVTATVTNAFNGGLIGPTAGPTAGAGGVIADPNAPFNNGTNPTTGADGTIVQPPVTNTTNPTTGADGTIVQPPVTNTTNPNTGADGTIVQPPATNNGTNNGTAGTIVQPPATNNGTNNGTAGTIVQPPATNNGTNNGTSGTVIPPANNGTNTTTGFDGQFFGPGCVANMCFNDVAQTNVVGRNAQADCSAFVSISTIAPTTVTVFTTIDGAIATTTATSNQTVTQTNTITSVATSTATSVVATSTVSSTTTVVPQAKRGVAGRHLFGRQAQNTAVPAYAAADCGNSAAYASACSCAYGVAVQTSTVTAAQATVTSTITNNPTTTTATFQGVVTETSNTITQSTTTTTTPVTTVSTQTVFVNQPVATCQSFIIQAVGGDNNGQYGNVVDSNDGLGDFVLDFVTDPNFASTLFINPADGHLRNQANQYFANTDDGSSGATIASLYFNPANVIGPNLIGAAYSVCQAANAGQLTCTTPVGNVFYTQTGALGVLVGQANQANSNAFTFNVINFQNVACT